jgi:hypothetical protein
VTPAELTELESKVASVTEMRRMIREGTKDGERVVVHHGIAYTVLTDYLTDLGRFVESNAPALLSAARHASMLEERNGKLEELLRRVQVNHWVVAGTLLADDIDAALAPSTKGEG